MVVDTKLYNLLGVDPSADKNAIKKAYRQLAVKHHPDKGGNEDTFKEINSAYKTLSDDNLRSLYDQTGQIDQSAQNSQPDMDIFSQIFSQMGMGHMNFDFAGGDRNPFKQKTSDMMHEIHLSLQQIYSGKKKTIGIKRTVICIKCNGVGGSDPKKCAACNGNGIVLLQQNNGFVIMQTQQQCKKCEGSGKIISPENKCEQCTGKGHHMDKKTVELHIPAGAPNGYTITMKGMADERVGCGTGDLYIIIREKPHEKYTRAGADLTTTVAIDLATALVGGTVHFEHLDGSTVNITLPKGKVIKQGDVVVSANKGMPIMLNNGKFGDLRVTFHIEMPSNNWATRINESVVRKIFNGDNL